MRYSVSDTAEHGDYTAGEKLITEETKHTMYTLLQEIKNGSYAQGWIEENKNGREWFNKTRRTQQDHLIERVGAELRQMMPFIDPITVKPGE